MPTLPHISITHVFAFHLVKLVQGHSQQCAQEKGDGGGGVPGPLSLLVISCMT